MINNPLDDIKDLLNRIARLNQLIHTHQAQPEPDQLTIEGYQRLRQQFADELSQLMRESYKGCISKLPLKGQLIFPKLSITMTRAELHALIDAQFDDLEALQKEPTFLAYEQKFAEIWTNLGCDVLQATVGQAPKNSRKKKQLSNPVWRYRTRA